MASLYMKIIPLAFRAKENGYSFDAHVRQRAYWDVFSGACGHTYGNHSVWQMYAPGRRPINGPLHYWYDAIHRPGAAQMQYVRALVESRPYFSRIPDQSLLANALEGRGSHLRHARVRITRSSIAHRDGNSRSTWVRFRAAASRVGGTTRARAARRKSKRCRIRAHANSLALRKDSEATGCWCLTTHRKASGRPAASAEVESECITELVFESSRPGHAAGRSSDSAAVLRSHRNGSRRAIASALRRHDRTCVPPDSPSRPHHREGCTALIAGRSCIQRRDPRR